MIDPKDFMIGCKKLGGTPTKESEWGYRCVIKGLSFGMNTNGLLMLFDRRGNAVNDASLLNFERFDLDDNNMVFTSDTGRIEIKPGPRGGVKVETKVRPHDIDRDFYSLEKQHRFGEAKIKVPAHSVLKMPSSKVGSIAWDTDELEPVLFADGRNIVKGTIDDFKSSSHEPELIHTRHKVPVVFRIGDEIAYMRKYKDGYPATDRPPMCIPIGNACFSRETLYGIAEEIIDKPILKPDAGIVSDAMGKTVKLEGFQCIDSDSDYEGAIRIIGKNGVNYVTYPTSFI